MKSKLFTPLKLRGLELKNRLVVSPMQQYCTPEGIVGDWHLVHLGSRAVGGAGLIIAEATNISPEGRMTKHDTGIWNDAQLEAWRPIVDFVRAQGSKIGIQLGHFGSKGSKAPPSDGFRPLSTEEGGWPTVSASAVAPFKGMVVPEALTIEKIHLVQDQFVQAAQRAVSAGFDTIEIHAAHGYLIHQFYSALINQRTDQYGGSFENRVRFLLEIVEKIRTVIPEKMPLMVRISAVDFLEDEKAWTLADSVRLAKRLKAAGVDLITASAGGFVAVPKSKVHPGYQVPFAAEIKQKSDISTGAVGAITTAQQANDILERNQADLIVIARAFLRDPYFGINAAMELGEATEVPWQYKRAYK